MCNVEVLVLIVKIYAINQGKWTKQRGNIHIDLIKQFSEPNRLTLSYNVLV